MTKIQVALMSLVAAVPGGVLVFLIVMSFLSGFDQMSGGLKGLSIVTLLASFGVMLMPVAVLVFGPKADAPEAGKAKTSDDEEAAVEPETLAMDEDGGEAEEAGSEILEADDDGLGDFEDADAVAGEDDVFVAADDEDFGEVDFDLEDEEEK